MERRILVEYLLTHPQAEPDRIGPLVEKLRLRAIGLGFVRVGELFILTNEADIFTAEFGRRFFDTDKEITPTIPMAVCYFTAALADSDPAEIGLGRFPTEIEFDGLVIPSGVPEWSWRGGIETRDLRKLSMLLRYAAEIGFGSYMTFAGIELAWVMGHAGKVLVEQGWDVLPDSG